MSDVVIHSEGLGKSYFIGHAGPRERYTTLRDVIARQARNVWESTRRAWRGQAVVAGETIEEFWALRDISFEVKQGEVVGIIGRNGAGKSTLLKILSRITEPTEGRATLRGRVASLLEVGTGFHPELTGRENIFLNGAILGMSRNEIKRKFDEIVSFAEVEKFLDTPVKRYSSGMNVRLAFAVAAHLEPEILVVDEVLAVGDSEFQKKCLGKMEDVSKGGRTVLFVSHAMGAVRRLCGRSIVLNHGSVVYDGSTSSAIETYLGSVKQASKVAFHPKAGRPSITSARVDPNFVRQGHLKVEISFDSPFALNPPVAGFVIYSMSGTPVFGSNPRMHQNGFAPVAKQEGILSFVAWDMPLSSGQYRLSIWLGDWHRDYDHIVDVLSFDFVNPTQCEGRFDAELHGHLNYQGIWQLISDGTSSLSDDISFATDPLRGRITQATSRR
jgi:lipopolysaccharide transport system ATP-binding protein